MSTYSDWRKKNSKKLNKQWIGKTITNDTLEHRDIFPAWISIIDEIDRKHADNLRKLWKNSSENKRESILSNMMEYIDEHAPDGSTFNWSIDGTDSGFYPIEEQ